MAGDTTQTVVKKKRKKPRGIGRVYAKKARKHHPSKKRPWTAHYTKRKIGIEFMREKKLQVFILTSGRVDPQKTIEAVRFWHGGWRTYDAP